MRMNRRKFLTVASAGLGSTLLAGCGASHGKELDASTPGSPGKAGNNDYDVIVIGGGIAGLTAAWYLDDRFSVKVLEKSDHVGGKAISGNRKGFSYPKGTEYLGEPEGALKEIIEDLELQLREIPSPSDVHYQSGKFYYGDDGITLQMIQGSSLSEYNRFVATIQKTYSAYQDIPELDLASEVAKLDDITARQWFNQNKFPEIFHRIYNVSSKGLFGATIDEISALSYISEIYFDYENSTPITNVADLENSDIPGRGRTYTYTFDTGIAEVTAALAKDLGDAVQLSSAVTSVNRDEQGYTVRYTDGSGNDRTLTSGLVILATPAPIALQMAATVLKDEQKSIMGEINYSSYVTVALFSDEPVFNKGFDLAVPDGYFFTDVYDSTWVQRHQDPSLQGRKDSIMSVYIAPKSYQDTAIFYMSDEEILQRVYEDLEKIYPGVRGKIVGHDIQRFRHAYPVMTVGAYKRLTRLHEISEGSLLLAGDYMIYPTFEAAVDSGFLAYESAVKVLGQR